MTDEFREYFGSASDERHTLLQALHELILSLYPRASQVISYGIPTYRLGTGWVSLGYWKGGVSLYTNGPHNIAQFTERYPAIKAGKGSLSFRLSDELPLEAIGKVIRRAMEPPDATGG